MSFYCQIHFYSFEELVWQSALYVQGIRLALGFGLVAQMLRRTSCLITTVIGLFDNVVDSLVGCKVVEVGKVGFVSVC